MCRLIYCCQSQKNFTSSYVKSVKSVNPSPQVVKFDVERLSSGNRDHKLHDRPGIG
jgi:hypothetical protein